VQARGPRTGAGISDRHRGPGQVATPDRHRGLSLRIQIRFKTRWARRGVELPSSGISTCGRPPRRCLPSWLSFVIPATGPVGTGRDHGQAQGPVPTTDMSCRCGNIIPSRGLPGCIHRAPISTDCPGCIPGCGSGPNHPGSRDRRTIVAI